MLHKSCYYLFNKGRMQKGLNFIAFSMSFKVTILQISRESRSFQWKLWHKIINHHPFVQMSLWQCCNICRVCEAMQHTLLTKINIILNKLMHVLTIYFSVHCPVSPQYIDFFANMHMLTVNKSWEISFCSSCKLRSAKCDSLFIASSLWYFIFRSMSRSTYKPLLSRWMKKKFMLNFHYAKTLIVFLKFQ